jgi:hypothetical protein
MLGGPNSQRAERTLGSDRRRRQRPCSDPARRLAAAPRNASAATGCAWPSRRRPCGETLAQDEPGLGQGSRDGQYGGVPVRPGFKARTVASATVSAIFSPRLWPVRAALAAAAQGSPSCIAGTHAMAQIVAVFVSKYNYLNAGHMVWLGAIAACGSFKAALYGHEH